MADYREISQQYARGAIKAVILLNGAAAIAVLSQFTALQEYAGPTTIACAILIYVLGTAVGALTWVFGFLSARHVDRAILEQEPDYKNANRFQLLGVISIVLSLVLFLMGALILVYAIGAMEASESGWF